MRTTSIRCQDKWQLERKVVTNRNILIKGEEKQVTNQGGGKFFQVGKLARKAELIKVLRT